MKSLPAQDSMNGLSSQSRTIALIAMLLFAFSGLISGFAVGAFVRPHFALLTAQNQGNVTITQKVGTTTPVSTEHPKPLGFPVIDNANQTEVADGTTLYTFSAHAVDQSIDKGHGKPVHASGITCRLWLVQSGQALHSIPANRLQSAGTLGSSPLPGEVQGLIFDPTTPQTQACNASGQATWKYKLDPSLSPGMYYLVVLMDWKGMHYNWSWIFVSIKHA